MPTRPARLARRTVHSRGSLASSAPDQGAQAAPRPRLLPAGRETGLGAAYLCQRAGWGCRDDQHCWPLSSQGAEGQLHLNSGLCCEVRGSPRDVTGHHGTQAERRHVTGKDPGPHWPRRTVPGNHCPPPETRPRSLGPAGSAEPVASGQDGENFDSLRPLRGEGLLVRWRERTASDAASRAGTRGFLLLSPLSTHDKPSPQKNNSHAVHGEAKSHEPRS